MTWILLALTGPALWAVSNLIDEHYIKHVFTSAYGYVALTGFFSGLSALGFFLFSDVGSVDLLTLLLCIIAGVLWIFLLVPYLFATKYTSAAAVSPLWNISSVAVAVIAIIFLHEPLQATTMVAIVLLIGSALVASYTSEATRAGKVALALMTLASLLYAAETVTEKIIFERVGYTTGFFYVALSCFATALGILLISKHARQTIKDNLNGRFILMNTTNEVVNQLGIICSTTAISLGPVSLVRAIGGLSPIYILILTLVWMTLRPKSKMTRPTKSLVVRVILAVILAVAGLALIQTSV